MKRIIATTLLGISATVNTVYGQGFVNFSNYNAPYYPIVYEAALGGGAVAGGDGVQVEVWGAAGTVGEGVLAFVDNANISGFAGYTDPNQIFTLPGYTTGQTWTLQLRASGTFGGQPVSAAGPLIVTSAIGDGSVSPPGTPQFNAALPFPGPPNGQLTVFIDAGVPPAIISQPQDLLLPVGFTANFQVVATGEEPLQYQWLFNDTNIIAGATTNTLALTNIQVSDAGFYSVLVSNAFGTALSSNALLQVGLPPNIVSQPQSQSVELGMSASFQVAAVGTAPLTYQWLFDGSAIVGATSDNLTLVSAGYANAGVYSVEVSNPAGMKVSSNATLTVNGPPVISSQPISQIVGPGATVEFAVQADGTQPFAYQWAIDGMGIAGETNQTLALPNVTTNDAGAYTVAVDNTFGSATSQPASLVLTVPPDYSGLTEILVEAVIDGSSELIISNDSVHWDHLSGFIPGFSTILQEPIFATALNQYDWNPTWPLDPGTAQVSYPLTSSMGSIDFSGEVIQGRGSVTFAKQGDSYVITFDDTGDSGEALYKVRIARTFPSIATQPQDVAVLEGANATFSVVAAGSAPLTYQWKKDGIDLGDATNSTLSLTGVLVTNAGPYTVVVANSIGAVSSQPAILTVLLPPSIVSQPVTQVVGLGAPASLSVSVAGTAPLTYQWQRYGTNVSDGGGLAGTTTQTLTFAGAQPQHEGPYRLVVTNDYGTVTSSIAGLVVQLPAWVSTFAGSGLSNLVNGYATDAGFTGPNTGEVGSDGALYVPDRHALRRVAADGLVTTLAGSYSTGFNNGSGDTALFSFPLAAIPRPSGNVLVADAFNHAIREVGSNGSYTVSTLTGTGVAGWQDGDCGVAQLNFPNDFAADDLGNVFFTEWTGQRVRKISPACEVSTIAGSGTSGWVDGVGTNASFQNPGGLGIDDLGNLYVSDYLGNRIRKVTPGGVVTTVAGNGVPGFIDGLGASASFNTPDDVAVGPDGSLYVCDSANHAIRRITPWGEVVTIVGDGSPGYVDGDAAIAAFDTPAGLTFDDSGNLLVMDGRNFVIRKVAFFSGTLQLAEIPTSRAVIEGNTTSFSLVALSSGTPTYQWLKNGTSILGATGSVYAVINSTVGDAGLYSVVVSDGTTVLTSSPPATLEVLVPPQIVSAPTNQSVLVGDTVVFSVTAQGTAPLSYQWKRDGSPLAGETSSQLTLTNVQLADSGNYSVTVSNVVTTVTSADAVLTVALPTYLTALDVAVTNLDAVTVPIELGASGEENALGFSLDFDSGRLNFSSANLGSGGAGASLLLNTNQAASGQVGVAIALGAGVTFPAGTQEVLQVTFSVSPPSSGSPELQLVSFGDVPTLREVVDVAASPRPTFYTAGTVTVPPANFEADVAPRPGGDMALSIADWVQVGRFVAFIDTAAAGVEFQRADCAPRVLRGDGQISVTDWVQAGRYAVGLDPATLAAGPDTSGMSAPLAFGQSQASSQEANGTRIIRVLPTSVDPGSSGLVVVQLEAQGDESALGFSLTFDPALLSYTSASLGADAGGATLNINTSMASSGQVGFAISQPIGSAFAAGTLELLDLSFQAADTTNSSTAVAFGDTPILRETSDALANPLPTTYEPGLVNIESLLLSLEIAAEGELITVWWDVGGTGLTNLLLQENTNSDISPAQWSNLPPEWVISSNGQQSVTVTNSGLAKYFRLLRP